MSKCFPFKIKEKGSALIFILGITSVISLLGVLTLNHILMRTTEQEKSFDQLGSKNIYKSVEILLGRKSLCTKNFDSLLTTVSANSLQNLNINRFYSLNSLGQKNTNPIFTLENGLSLSVTNPRPVCPNTRRFIADLVIVTNRDLASHSVNTINTNTQIYIQADNSGRFEGCTTNKNEFPKHISAGQYCESTRLWPNPNIPIQNTSTEICSNSWSNCGRGVNR